MRRDAIAPIALVLSLHLPACGLLFPPDDDVPCEPLAALVVDDLTTGPFDVLTDFGFCGVAHAHQFQIYSVQTTPTALPQLEIYDTDWTFPPGTRVEDLVTGAAVQFGTESGEVCARHSNTCTEPGAFVCQPITVVSENVWAPLRTELDDVAGGAIAIAGGTAWYLMPRFRSNHAMWRFDRDDVTWRLVEQTFPEGSADTGSFTGGAAIGHGDFIDYLVLDRAFRFDTTTSTWAELAPPGHSVVDTAASVVIDGRLWIVGGEIWSWDPATQSSTSLGEVAGGVQDAIAFERGGDLVVGGGFRCDQRDPNCWVETFSRIDLTTGLGTVEPYGAATGPRLYTQALDFGDRVVLVTQQDEAFVLADGEDTLAPIVENPDLGCAPPTPVHGAWLSRGVVLDGVGLLVGGVDDIQSIAARPTATIYRP
jgi:hypothetical protein